MRVKELFLSGLAYLVAVTAAYFIAGRFMDDPEGLSLFIGTMIGTYTAIILYQFRNDVIAPAKVKLTVGITLAVLCVLQGITYQHFFHWMQFPDVSIFFGVVGALSLPFLFWNRLGTSIIASRNVKK